MSENSEQILKQALALTPHERAELVEHLLAALQSLPTRTLMSCGLGKRKTGWTPMIAVNSRPFVRRKYSEDFKSQRSAKLIRTGSGSDRVTKDEDWAQTDLCR